MIRISERERERESVHSRGIMMTILNHDKNIRERERERERSFERYHDYHPS